MDSDRRTPEYLNALVVRLRAAYASDPNIVHVSWGLPRRQGRTVTETAIIFHVKEKLRTGRQMQAIGTTPVPKEIEGIPTDVRVEQTIRAEGILGSRDHLADPLNGGWLTGTYSGHTFWWGEGGGGTLGILCTDNATGDAMALSNWHVWAQGFENGDNILQPSTPEAGQYVEGTVKVLACGPLLTSLIDWDSPDPVTWGLYGGAAAAAIAAALSDHRDPTRRGQDATPVDPAERTQSESVDAAIEYPDLPVPGRPFRSAVEWKYARHTDRAVHAHGVRETLANPQFLIGKHVTSDQPSYSAGSLVRIQASIWDYQPRPCDAYFVVAHVIPEKHPTRAYRVVLHPDRCRREPQRERVCAEFQRVKAGARLSSLQAFGAVKARTVDGRPLRLVDWVPQGGDGAPELAVPDKGVIFWHAPARQVIVDIVRFHDRPVTLSAYDAAGIRVGQTSSSAGQGTPETLTISAPMIARTVLTGGANEAVVVRYCFVEQTDTDVVVEISKELAETLQHSHVRTHDEKVSTRLRGRRCCFSGTLRVPPLEDPGQWRVLVFVQNVNHVPENTPAEEAATVIGGHALSTGVPGVLGCTAIMLADHVFDII